MKIFLKIIKALELPKGKFAIFGSGPMAVRKLREGRDVDLIVTEDILDEYKEKPGWQYRKFTRDKREIEAVERDAIEMYKDWGPGKWNIKRLINESEIIDGLPFVRLEEVLRWKKISAREKDLNDIKLIEEFLKKYE
ncbi:hypothetical protein ACFL29_00480 [Patescibacteria group bacterium]